MGEMNLAYRTRWRQSQSKQSRRGQGRQSRSHRRLKSPGNAGLRLLSQFKFDVVKIDLSLVQGARQDQTMSVLTSLVQLANRWGAVTIAEGVETPTQLRTIRALGITAGQGYLLGRPGTERDIAWIDLDALEAREDDSPAAPPQKTREAHECWCGGFEVSSMIAARSSGNPKTALES